MSFNQVSNGVKFELEQKKTTKKKNKQTSIQVSTSGLISNDTMNDKYNVIKKKDTKDDKFP